LKALRDVTPADLEKFGKDLPEVIYRRCRHVITENARVLAAAEALKHERLFEFGELMAGSHHSLRYDYEVSCMELDVMVGLAGRIDGVYGARMTGGGFGGCTINIVDAKQVERFKSIMAHDYQRFTDLKPEIYICEASNGAEEI
jgi:galactokinase